MGDKVDSWMFSLNFGADRQFRDMVVTHMSTLWED